MLSIGCCLPSPMIACAILARVLAVRSSTIGIFVDDRPMFVRKRSTTLPVLEAKQKAEREARSMTGTRGGAWALIVAAAVMVGVMGVHPSHVDPAPFIGP